MAHLDDPETQRANVRFIRQSMKQPLLSREHEMDLATRWRENHDEDALHELVKSYTRLVVSMAGRFRNYGLPIGDLVQEGNIGLMQAAARFEPSRDVRFSTYASWWIRSAIQDFVLRNWSIVRTGTTSAQKSLFFNLRRLRAKIADASATRLTDEQRGEIAEELKVNLSDVEQMENRLFSSDQSLNATIGEEGEDDWLGKLEDDGPNPEEVVMGLKDAESRTRWLAEAIGELSEREQTIIRRRRLREEGDTLEELGKQLGVSKERVRQLEHRALEKLKDSIMARVERPADLMMGY